MKLFLDDIRDPISKYHGDVVIARNNDEAKELVELHGFPEEIFFDHDLGFHPAGDAPVFMSFLINRLLDIPEELAIETIKNTKIEIHSSNPPGAKNLYDRWLGVCLHFDIGTPQCKIVPFSSIKIE